MTAVDAWRSGAVAWSGRTGARARPNRPRVAVADPGGLDAGRLEAVLRRIDAARLRTLLCGAVDAYSPTYAEDPATAVFAAHLLSEAGIRHAGLRVERQRVARPSGPLCDNLLIQLGPAPLGLLLVGHVDTIVAGDGAMEFRPAAVAGDLLTGLGAADMKSGCAAMVEAVLAVAASGVRLERGIGVALVVGEEEYGDGSLALPAHFHAPLIVVGEPTSLQPCASHYGYLECRMRSHGARAHAALTGHGGNAIHAMLAWMLGVLEALPAVQPDATVAANPRLIRGGDTLFVVAEHCEAMLDVHWQPGADAVSLLACIETVRSAVAASHPACRLELEPLFAAPAFVNDPAGAALGPLRSAFEATGLAWAPGTFPSHSDAGIFQARGGATVVCGPGALAAAHAPGEAVSLLQTEAAARLYAALAVGIAGQRPG
ncbi:MAG: M20 family peptidase [Myxococcales bacterium]|nr:M20 family peptidase [Myxococcales bacterium]